MIKQTVLVRYGELVLSVFVCGNLAYRATIFRFEHILGKKHIIIKKVFLTWTIRYIYPFI